MEGYLIPLIEKLKKINNNVLFENLLCVFLIFFGFIGWRYNYLLVAIPSVLISVILMFLFRDFKYAIPTALVLLFSYGKGFDVEEFPYDIVIPVVVYVISILVFTIINFKKSKIKKIKNSIGIIIISIAFIIPIFWSNLITNETKIYYIMYFSWFLYLLLFALLCINLEKGSFRIVVFAFSWLSILIVCELAVTLYECYLTNTARNILSWWYYIGWGLCNEAGIVLCFIMPFIFYELFSSKKTIICLLSIIKIFILLFGILITGSRGSLLFGGIEFLALFIALIVLKTPNKNLKISSITFITLIGFMGLLIYTDYKLFDDILDGIFSVKFDDLGRKEIWYSGIDCWSLNVRNMIFGSGIVSNIDMRSVYNGVQNTFLVYHSTTIEILVSSGIIGLIGLGIHFAEKYQMLIKKNNALLLLFIIGYFVVDIYGLIDNTYGMYYYMVPLVITMATFNCNDNYELFDF